MENFVTFIVTFFTTLIVALIFDLLLAWPAMLLWNWLMPLIFHLPEITFWQAFGLGLLLSLIFPGNKISTSKK